MCLHPPTKKLKDLVVLREGKGRKEKEMNQKKIPPPQKKINFKACTLLKVSDNVEHTVRLRYAIFFLHSCIKCMFYYFTHEKSFGVKSFGM